MARDSKTPMRFQLPDNDEVVLITWDYVVDKLANLLNPIIEIESEVNVALKNISDKLDEWIDEEE